ncbi:hypothetical protein MFM001_42750 [Mycobacterium sp. MFM001]|nr:hypothetical protein MFM001_42750 [Mycobacterium sp. MFM001]
MGWVLLVCSAGIYRLLDLRFVWDPRRLAGSNLSIDAGGATLGDHRLPLLERGELHCKRVVVAQRAAPACSATARN